MCAKATVSTNWLASSRAKPYHVLGDIIHHVEPPLLHISYDGYVAGVAVCREGQARLRGARHVEYPRHIQVHLCATRKLQCHGRNDGFALP